VISGERQEAAGGPGRRQVVAATRPIAGCVAV